MHLTQEDMSAMEAMGYTQKEINRIQSRLHGHQFTFTLRGESINFENARRLISNDNYFFQGLALAGKFAPIMRSIAGTDCNVRIENK